MTDSLTQEPILTTRENQYTFFPTKYPDILAMTDKAESAIWTVHEVDPGIDLLDWKSKLTDNEKYFIKHILAFFAASDGIVMENLALRFTNEIELPEVKAFYAVQNFMESVHSRMYSLLIETYINDDNEKNNLFNAINTLPCVQKKADWSIQWIQDENSTFAQRLIAFAIVEGIFFSGAFCAIYWLKKRGLMQGLCLSNEFISGDEALHTDFACLLYSKIVNRVDEDIVKNMFLEAVKLEKEFIIDSIPCNMIGMNAKLMSQYIEFVSDRLIVQLGYPKIYNSSNPFEFMESISIRGKNNFFDRRSSEYSKPTGDREFSLDADF